MKSKRTSWSFLLTVLLLALPGQGPLMAQDTFNCELVGAKRVDQTFASRAEANEWIQNNGEKFASDLCRAEKCPDSRCELVAVEYQIGALEGGRFEIRVLPRCRCLKGINEGCSKIEMIGTRVEIFANRSTCAAASQVAEALALLVARNICSYGFCTKVGEDCIPKLKIKKDDIRCVEIPDACNCFIDLRGDMVKCKCG